MLVFQNLQTAVATAMGLRRLALHNDLALSCVVLSAARATSASTSEFGSIPVGCRDTTIVIIGALH